MLTHLKRTQGKFPSASLVVRSTLTARRPCPVLNSPQKINLVEQKGEKRSKKPTGRGRKKSGPSIHEKQEQTETVINISGEHLTVN